MCLRFLRCDHASSTPRASECAHTADPAKGGSFGRRGGRRLFSSNSWRSPSTYLRKQKRQEGDESCFHVYDHEQPHSQASSRGREARVNRLLLARHGSLSAHIFPPFRMEVRLSIREIDGKEDRTVFRARAEVDGESLKRQGNSGEVVGNFRPFPLLVTAKCKLTSPRSPVSSPLLSSHRTKSM